MKPTTQQEKGFTLVETMITTVIFTMVVIGVMGIFGQMLIIQRRGSAAQRIQENVQYVLELMAREIRVSRLAPGQDADCITTTRDTLSIDYPVDAGSVTIVYSITPSGVVRRQEGGITEDISSPEVVFTNMYFCVVGSGNDGKQPRVAIVSSVRDVGNPSNEVVYVQTTIVPRQLDVF